jgi:protocatechuate 3,4-dioxygenase beta subunit
LECYRETRHYVSFSSFCASFTIFSILHTNSEGKPGIPLRLTVTVLDTKTCSPVPDAVVDVWQCDALGIYSHFVGLSLGQMNAKSDNTTFFRGRILFIPYSLSSYCL